MSTHILSLPIPLIILVHLHILEYPHANKPEYDHNIFEPRVRGLRERTKLLEDVAYFLVGRLEGTARKVLSTYPCAAPSDTVAFRTSLSKYLETLRHVSIYPTSKAITGASGKTKGKEPAREADNAAWWWKDVIVRKSLLEECAGERFERLMLSVSTHAVLKSIPQPLRVIPEDMNLFLSLQPTLYADLLTRCMSARHAWAQSAAHLLQREADLRLLREHLRSHGGDITSKYSTLSIERLSALVEAKCQDLLRHRWSDPSGRRALDFLAKACGLEVANASSVEHNSLNPTNVQSKSNYPAVAPLPLPLAAGHHPGHVKKLRKPVFSTPKPQRPVQSTEAVAMGKRTRSMATIMFSDRSEYESRIHEALSAALEKARNVGHDIAARAKALQERRQARRPRGNPAFTLDLWQPDPDAPVNFDIQPTPELLAAFSLDAGGSEAGIEVRIDEIRNTVLPAYPPVPDLSAPRAPHPEAVLQSSKTEPSKIPRGGLSKPSRPVTPPRPPSPGLLTSTPPATIRLPTGHCHKVVANQGKAKPGTQRTSKAPRKSIRFSLAINRRPSLFATGNLSDEEDVLQSDVHRIIHGIQDNSTDEEDLAPMTPKAKPKPVNRIFTGKKGGSTMKRPKQSYPMVFQEPAVPLPSLVSGSTSFDDLLAYSDADDDSGLYTDEAPSMTLREILLSADTTQFALLEDEPADMEGESFDWE
ncbi:hypothetical protein FPV67DRAFT_1474082 [Lyophyllum atratum]|nr:hypothetical protein FPV67DRAFT_1474082 [Lyophyllum atratum]